MPVPSVTIEDLQAFQAKHFPNSDIAGSTYAYNEHVTDAFADEEDSLGYYPDGVRRTLTDEQIEIFRHSEIHALLREKQLREEEMAQGPSHSEGAPANEGKTATGQGSQSTPVDGEAGPLLSDTKLPEVEGKPNGSTNPVLDYDESVSGGGSQKPRPLPYNAPFAGRRIVSYDD
ncbi:hypothetical protein BDV25DRAFT_18709 [Aspergillus avenaceus]|uniref:Uncharacterized protein n=1 Tax=Aspergillus avenaceus TaxID=36643 RepID=A0A5N6U5D0_ASPAV|nr:hypothetical protein BDV25DRAFT_18709 [Aspergillus avenaceus]